MWYITNIIKSYCNWRIWVNRSPPQRWRQESCAKFYNNDINQQWQDRRTISICQLCRATVDGRYDNLKYPQWRQTFHYYISRVSIYWTHRGRDKMVTILQTTFSYSFSWMDIIMFFFNLHWNLFPRVTDGGILDWRLYASLDLLENYYNPYTPKKLLPERFDSKCKCLL